MVVSTCGIKLSPENRLGDPVWPWNMIRKYFWEPEKELSIVPYVQRTVDAVNSTCASGPIRLYAWFSPLHLLVISLDIGQHMPHPAFALAGSIDEIINQDLLMCSDSVTSGLICKSLWTPQGSLANADCFALKLGSITYALTCLKKSVRTQTVVLSHPRAQGYSKPVCSLISTFQVKVPLPPPKLHSTFPWAKA